jgi:hypothetical protein
MWISESTSECSQRRFIGWSFPFQRSFKASGPKLLSAKVYAKQMKEKEEFNADF